MTLGLVVGVLASVAPAAQAAGASRRVIISKAQLPASSGAGGTVTSTSSPTQTTQLNCGSTCTVSYSRYASVTITATADANSTLVGFSSNCARPSATATTCTIASLSADTTVTVTFARKQALTVTKGSVEGGSGSVTAGAGAAYADCATAPCSATSNETYNSSVSLTATADATSRFMGWSGCTSTSGTGASICSVTMSGAKAVTASFRKTYPLTATKASTGTGAGTLTAAGTTCAPSCTSRSISSESVTLTAAPATGSVFSGWEGDVGTCTTAASCTLLMDRARTVTARFTSLETLTVTVEGSGSLTSSPAGTTGSIVDCSTTCSATFPHGTSVTLTASSPESARFAGWVGCTSATAACAVTVSGATSVTATFGALNKLQVTTTNSAGGGGSGSVSATGIDCGSDCYEWFEPDTELVLTAQPASGSRFGSWTGPCAESDPTSLTCTVTLSTTTSVTADFVKVWDLTVAAVGSGAFGGSVAAGTLTVGCAGDACAPTPATGTVTYDHGTVVTLSAAPDLDAFVTWSGDIGSCAATDADCIVTMDQARTVTATFAQIEYDVAVALSGSGDEFGSVTSDPAGIDCPDGDCTASFGIHAEVALLAVAAAGSRFDGWTGPCIEEVLTGDTCTVKVEGAVDVTATFVALHDLTIAIDPAGDGTGAVTSDVGGIDCPDGACVATYDEGDDIVLTAAPDEISRVIGWSGGGCSGTGLTCTVTGIAAATTVTVTFAKKIFTLAVTTTGTGSVTSDVGAIDCGPGGATCSDTYLIDTVVTLTPVFDPAVVRFDGWGGACSGTGACEVTMTQAESVSATFVTIWALAVTATDDGTGTGTVTSADGIDCPATLCTKTYDTGTDVTLQANPGPTSMVGSWSGGGCTGAGPTCTVAMTQARSVTVTFTKLVYPLALTKTSVGGGTGTIAIASESYTCDAACTSFTRSYEPGTSVTLSQAPSPGSWFVGWGGACATSGTAATCTVSVDAATTVTATFETMPVLTVAKSGIGSGTITWTDAAGDHIDCGTDCTSAVITNTVITLTATPLASNGSTLTGWSIRACGTALTCSVTMSASTTVTATFTAPAAYVALSKSSLYSGSGSVVSQPTGISCAASCTKTQTGTYANFATVTLVATPSADSYIVGWGDGQCDLVSSDLTRCVMTLGAAGTTRPATVTFARPQLSLSKSSISQGRGSVSGPNLNCGNTCNSRTVVYSPGQSVTLSATPASGSIFVRWAGDGSCAGTVPTCTVTMDRARSVVAVFGQGLLLSVVKSGGNGLVYWAGNSSLTCGDVCATAVASGTTVTLVASPDSGYVFVRWEGVAACVTDPVDQFCSFSVTSGTTVTAVFAPDPGV